MLSSSFHLLKNQGFASMMVGGDVDVDVDDDDDGDVNDDSGV